MIKDQPNHTNQINEPQSSYCLVVHGDAHLSYKRYKVEKFCFKGHPRYTSTDIHKTHTISVFFKIFSFFFRLKNLKTKYKNKQTNKASKTRLT